MLKDTRKMVFLALLTTLSVLLSRFFSFRVPLGGVDALRIGFGGLPMIFAGICFSPLAGGIVGVLADLIGLVLSPMGPYLPHFTLSAFLTGFIPGFIILYLFKGYDKYWQILIAIAIGQGITTLILVPYFLYTLFGQPFLFNFIPRLVTFPIQIPFYAYFIKTLLNYWPAELVKNQKSS